MRALVLSDIHGAQLNIEALIHETEPDVIIIPGDLPSSVDVPALIISMLKNRDRSEYIRNFYERFFKRANLKQIRSSKIILTDLLEFNLPVILNHGNTETRETRSWMRLFAIRKPNLHYIADSQFKLDNFQFIGHGWVDGKNSGDRKLSPGEVEYELAKTILLDTIGKSAPLTRNTILVSHAPPYGTRIDYLPHSKTHAGSRAIREVMDSGYFKGVICGHLHESPGAIKTSLGWWGVNAGAVVEDKACLIDLNTQKIQWISQLIKNPTIETMIYQNRRSYNYDKANVLTKNEVLSSE